MKQYAYYLSLILALLNGVMNAQEESSLQITTEDGEVIDINEEMMAEIQAFRQYSDSLDATFNYQYGKVELEGGSAIIEIPEEYKFLDKVQTQKVLTEIWGNPEDPSSLGLLVKKDESPADISYAIEISYSEEGYIEDDDAKDLDYDDLLEEMQEDAAAVNPERQRLGYPTVNLVGWASDPFYDETTKKLHWAKELEFEGEDINTLNYNVRVLGRRGYMNLNVIGEMDVLEDVKANIDPILNSVSFMPGNQYADFDPDIDEVAAYGIGGLIAGKVLAKVGFFALIAKFWKFIAIGAVALFAGFRKRFSKTKAA